MKKKTLKELIPQLQLPVSHEVLLRGHNKLVSALSMDASGARVVTGSYDYQVRDSFP